MIVRLVFGDGDLRGEMVYDKGVATVMGFAIVTRSLVYASLMNVTVTLESRDELIETVFSISYSRGCAVKVAIYID